MATWHRSSILAALGSILGIPKNFSFDVADILLTALLIIMVRCLIMSIEPTVLASGKLVKQKQP